MEKHSAHIIQMAVQGEETAASLVVPDFDLVVIATRDEQRLGGVERDASYRSYMKLLFESCCHLLLDVCVHSALPSCSSKRSSNVPMR